MTDAGKKGGDQDASVQTKVDGLLKLLKERRQIAIPDAARRLNMSDQLLESWARFLEQSGDVKIVYKLTVPWVTLPDETPDSVAHVKDKDAGQDAPRKADNANLISKTLTAASRELTSLGNEARKLLEGKRFGQLTSVVDQMISLYDRLVKTIEKHAPELSETSLKELEDTVKTLETDSKDASKLAKRKHYEQSAERYGEMMERLDSFYKKLAALGAPGDETEEEMSAELTYADISAKVREALDAGDLDRAQRLYKKLSELYEAQLPRKYEQARHEIREKLYGLKKDLAFASDAQVKQTFDQLAEEIISSLDAYESHLKAGEFGTIATLDERIVSLYNALPPGFEKRKQQLETQYGNLVMRSAKLKRKHLNDTLTRQREALQQMREGFQQAMAEGDITNAQKHYASLKAEYQKLPEDLFLEKTDLQLELLDDFKLLATEYKRRFVAHNEQQIKTCTQQVEALKDALKTGDLTAAQDAYDAASEALTHINQHYFEQRSRLQYDLMRAHKDLLDSKASTSRGKFEELAKEFQSTLNDGRQYLKSREYRLADKVYLKLLKIYSSLPPGFMQRKEALRKQIFDFYQEISAGKQTEQRGERMPALEQQYDAILEKLVSVHHSLNSGDFKGFAATLASIEQEVAALPGAFRTKNPALDEGLAKLRRVRDICEDVSFARSRPPEDVPARNSLEQQLRGHIAWLDQNGIQSGPLKRLLTDILADLDPNGSEARAKRASQTAAQDQNSQASAPTAQQSASEDRSVREIVSLIDSIKHLIDTGER